jgi:hypothetical protein
VAVGTIAERAGIHPKNAARALGRLRDRGVIEYVPGRGRGNISTVGLLAPREVPGDPGAVTHSLQAEAALEHPQEPFDGSDELTDLGGFIRSEGPAEHPRISVPPLRPEVAMAPAAAGYRPVSEPARQELEPQPQPEPQRLATKLPRPLPVLPPQPAHERSQEVVLAERVLGLFNQAAETDFAFAEWGGLVLRRVLEQPHWTLARWQEVIERAFAIAWWTRKLAPGEPPTPQVIFSSARQVESSLNVPDRLLAADRQLRGSSLTAP